MGSKRKVSRPVVADKDKDEVYVAQEAEVEKKKKLREMGK
jgi:hypothetical protein